jgi:hypothetical protein
MSSSCDEHRAKLTLVDIENAPGETIDVKDVASFLGMDAQCMRNQAQDEPAKLGFPVTVVGSRVVIPRRGFVHFIRYGYAYGRNGA